MSEGGKDPKTARLAKVYPEPQGRARQTRAEAELQPRTSMLAKACAESLPGVMGAATAPSAGAMLAGLPQLVKILGALLGELLSAELPHGAERQVLH
jgi:hypothetical protein